MNISSPQASDKILNVFSYLIATLCLALLFIGAAKYFLDDGGWINYLIVAVIFFCVVLAIKVCKWLASAK